MLSEKKTPKDKIFKVIEVSAAKLLKEIEQDAFDYKLKFDRDSGEYQINKCIANLEKFTANCLRLPNLKKLFETTTECLKMAVD